MRKIIGDSIFACIFRSDGWPLLACLDGFLAFATRSSGPRRLGSAMSMHLLLGRPSGVLALAQLGGSPSFAARSVGS